MLTIFSKKSTSTSSLACTDHFVFKLITGLLRHFTDEDLVTHQTFFRIRALKNDILAIVAPIRFSIIATNRELLNVFEMHFVGIEKRVGGQSGVVSGESGVVSR